MFWQPGDHLLVQLVLNYPSNYFLRFPKQKDFEYFIFYCQDFWANQYNYNFNNLVATKSNLYLKHLMKVVQLCNIQHELLNFITFYHVTRVSRFFTYCNFFSSCYMPGGHHASRLKLDFLILNIMFVSSM